MGTQCNHNATSDVIDGVPAEEDDDKKTILSPVDQVPPDRRVNSDLPDPDLARVANIKLGARPGLLSQTLGYKTRDIRC
jgi:hypothetical protein